MDASPLKRITANDREIREALEQAELLPLLVALAHATGDMSVLRPHLCSDPTQAHLPQGGLSPEQQAEARAVALRVLAEFRDEGCKLAPRPDRERLLGLMEFASGGTMAADYLPLLEEELSVGRDRRAPTWHKREVAPGRTFSVAIIGAGMSGLLAAYRLKQAGVEFCVIEKNDDVGGTWFENSYPGCRVDVPNHLYSYSFAQKNDWPHHYSPRDVLFDYFRGCAERLDIRDHIRFGTEVVSATFSDDDCMWTLSLREDGVERELQANAVISAVGQLNRPRLPDIVGAERFEGPAFHSAQWDHTIELQGKRVAVIGTGASAIQLIPEVAEQAAELTVFQRTPPWLGPTADYHEEVGAGQQWLLEHVPFYSQWYRFTLFWRFSDARSAFFKIDPDWPHQHRAVSERNDFVRAQLAAYLEREFADSPELLSKVIPSYPPFAKRVLRDNGVWARTLKRPHVDLVTDAISEITPRTIRTSDGREHPIDVIIYGTGFQASRFLTPMKVRGRRGADLHDEWAGTGCAYLGVTIPNFPNFYCLYGPNTNLVIAGSIIFMAECQVRYVVDCLRVLLQDGHDALDCRPEVYRAFRDHVDRGNRQMVWSAPGVDNWYKNERGEFTQNWPFTLLEYWRLTQRADPERYEALKRLTPVAAAGRE